LYSLYQYLGLHFITTVFNIITSVIIVRDIIILINNVITDKYINIMILCGKDKEW